MDFLGRLLKCLPASWLRAAGRAQWRHPWLKRSFEWVAQRFRNRDGVIQHGIGRGLRFNPAGANAGYVLGTSEPKVQQALAKLLQPGQTFYDIGANVGFLAVLAAKLVGPTGMVVAWDPVAANGQAVEHNFRLNQFAHLRLRVAAVSAVAGTAEFQLSAESTWGSLVNSGKEVNHAAGRITVPLETLDDLRDVPLPDVIKIDVEGAEADVLRGAQRLLREHGPLLMIELHGTNAAVAPLLEAVNYQSVVLGASTSITASLWDAYVIAVPARRAEWVARLPEFTQITDQLS